MHPTRSHPLIPMLAAACALPALAQPGVDPNLDPAVQDDYHPQQDAELVEPPPAGWQVARIVASPTGALYYFVDDANAFIEQLPAQIAARVTVRPRGQTPFDLDLVIDPVGNTAEASAGSWTTGGGVWFNTPAAFSLALGSHTPSSHYWPSYFRLAHHRALVPLNDSGDPFLRYHYVGPIDGGYSPGWRPEAPEPPQPAPVPTIHELGLAALAGGDAQRAVDLLRAHTAAHPDDARATRTLALALLAANQLSDAASVMRLAYVRNPSLGSQPIDADALLATPARLHRLAGRAARFAHRADSASAWLLACTLTQARDKPTPALAMLDRAKVRGLEPAVARVIRVDLLRR